MRILAIVLVLSAMLSGIAAAQDRDAAPIEADRIVAVVNDEVITRSELDRRVAEIEQQSRQQKFPLPPRDQVEKRMLERMIIDRAQLQLARETGLKVDDAQLDLALSRIAENNRLSLADFRMVLERDGIAWDRFREDIRSEMVITRLREREVDNRVTVSEGEIENYLASPAAREGTGEEYRIAHIIMRLPEQAAPEQIERVRARALEALEQIQRGTDFSQVAASYSEAPDAPSGGELGWRAAARLPALYAEAVASMQPGTTSEVLRSPAGFHIVRLIDRRGGEPLDRKVEQTHARHILIRTGELVSEPEAQRKVEDLKDRLDHGADFAELARLHSNDLSASRGGDLGWVYAGDTVPEFERAMQALKPGEISAPVHTPFGWHLIQVLERRIDDASPERRRLAARAALRSRKADEAYQEWLRQLRDSAYVEIRLEDN